MAILGRKSLLVSVAVGALGIGLSTGVIVADQSSGTAQAKPELVVAGPSIFSAGKEATIADVAERALPSVVNISTTKAATAQKGFSLRGLFNGPAPDREARSLGSGVIVSAGGYVVTNNHVVSDSTSISVKLNDGRDFSATLVGADPKSDVAVLKLNGSPTGLTPITIGKSGKLRLGEVVIAIGNPFGVGQTVTMGIVSAKGRSNVSAVEYEDFIQTDAAINPGNSGGALINMRGELVGINTAILSRSGGFQGIGFAIPTDMARPIMTSLMSGNRFSRGWLGVGIQPVNRDLADTLNLRVASGVLVTSVSKGSPAQKAGLRRNDVVTAVNGKITKDTSQLRNTIAMAGSGKTVNLTVDRDGKKKTLRVKLGELKDGVVAQRQPTQPTESGKIGIAVRDLQPEEARELANISKGGKGVMVTNIMPGSPAAAANLRPGDVILSVNRTPVRSASQFTKVARKTGKKVVFLVQRGEYSIYVIVKR